MRTIVSLFLLLGCAVPTVAQQGGSVTFENHCSLCHGGDGSGGRAPSLLGFVRCHMALWHLNLGQQWQASSITYILGGRQCTALAGPTGIFTFSLNSAKFSKRPQQARYRRRLSDKVSIEPTMQLRSGGTS